MAILHFGKKETEPDFSGLTNEELEHRLRLDCEQEQSADHKLLHEMEELASRYREEGRIEKTPEEAFRVFLEAYAGEPDEDEELPETAEPVKTGKCSRWFMKLVGAVAVLLLVVFVGNISVIASPEFQNQVADWTDGFFCFHSEDSPSPTVYPDYVKKTGFWSFQEMLIDKGVTTTLFPKDVPEGYALVYLNSTDKGVISFTSMYDKGDDILKMCVRISDPECDGLIIEKDDTPVEEYVSNGVVFYIMHNVDNWVVAYTIDQYECLITSTESLEYVKELIDSIFE